MRVRLYVDIQHGDSLQSVTTWKCLYAHPNPSPLREGYRRFAFDVDFPPGTFTEETQTVLPIAMAKMVDQR